MAEITRRGRHDEFFERARVAATKGKFPLAIDLYLHGLSFVQDLVPIHQELRRVSLERTADGGKSLGMFEVMKLQMVRRGPVDRLLAREKLLCYDPGNVDYMQAFCEAAHDAGALATAKWARELIEKAQESR